MKLIDRCGSRFLFQICGWLYDHNVRYRRLAGSVSYPGRNVRDEHRAISEAALERDTQRACDLLIGHYNATGSYLRALLGAGRRTPR